jgi:hypothetical protein
MIASGRPLFTKCLEAVFCESKPFSTCVGRTRKEVKTLTKAKQMVAGALLCVLMPGVMSSPALVINDARVPAENYAPANAAG